MSVPGYRPWGWWNETREIYRHTLIDPAPPVVRSVRTKGPRGTTDKTGQNTRARIRAALLKRWGPYCHLCLLWGAERDAALIDMTLPFPDPQCFTRDHVKPRSLKGALHSIANQRPAHNRCNSFRGNKTIDQARDCRPGWVTQATKEATCQDG